MLSTVPSMGDSTVVLNHLMKGRVSAIGSPRLTSSPSALSMNPGSSSAVMPSRLTTFTVETLPGSSVRATTCCRSTVSPGAASTSPFNGSRRVRRRMVWGVTYRPGV